MADLFDIVIRNGTVVNHDGRSGADLGIRGETIAAIGQNLGPGRHEIDASGRLVMPGGVDPHAHIEQLSGMGVMNADTFETATHSAALGGTTSVISFAAQQKGQRLRDTVEDYAARAARGAMIDHAFHLSVSDTDVPGFSSDLAALVAEGHRSIKVFTTYNIRLDDRQIADVLALARAHGALVCVHAENDGLIGWARDALLSAGLTRPHHHAASHPRLAEIEAVARLCRFAEFFATPVMLFHISARESLDILRAARARGVPVWAETCPHYLEMNEDVLACDGLDGAKWMCSPPQRGAGDSTALWAALAARELQVVSSDHAPYRFDDSGKLSAGPEANFAQIANGLPGLETRLPILFDAMISNGRLQPEDFVDLTAAAPARIYGLETKGQLAVGLDADVTVWNPDATRTYGSNDLHDNVGYNPWEGRSIRGLPQHVVLRGTQIVEDGRFRGRPGQGRWLKRDRIGVRAAIAPAPELQLIERQQR